MKQAFGSCAVGSGPQSPGPVVQTLRLKYILHEFSDFLTRYTLEEGACIECCQVERRKQDVPDDWWGGAHKETGSSDLVVTLAEISNDIPCYMDSICSPSTRSKCWRLFVSTVSP